MRAVGGHFRESFRDQEAARLLDARVSWVGTIMCLTGYAILIPKMGVWGAVYATAGSFAVLALYAFITAQGLWRVQYEYDRLAKIALSAMVPVGVFYWLQPESFWMQAGLGIAYWLWRSSRSCRRAISGTTTKKNTFAGYGLGYRRAVKPQAAASKG